MPSGGLYSPLQGASAELQIQLNYNVQIQLIYNVQIQQKYTAQTQIQQNYNTEKCNSVLRKRQGFDGLRKWMQSARAGRLKKNITQRG